jgi:hypothetical protein
MWTGARQANRVRGLYLRAVLRQDIQYFDRDATTGKLLLGLNEETLALQNGISEKVRAASRRAVVSSCRTRRSPPHRHPFPPPLQVGTFVHNFGTFAIGMAIAFWKVGDNGALGGASQNQRHAFALVDRRPQNARVFCFRVGMAANFSHPGYGPYPGE